MSDEKELSAEQAPAGGSTDIKKLISDLLAGVERLLEEIATHLPPQVAHIGRELAKRGWYLNFDMDFSGARDFSDLLESGNLNAVDARIAEAVRARIPGFQQMIETKFPKRASIVREALNAHERRAYEVAIPTLFSQAEGISIDLLDTRLFATSHGALRVAVLLESLNLDDFTAAFLAPVKSDLGMLARESKRHEYPDVINRHEVMHGIDTNYASEINSLKAISLVDFVGSVLWSLSSERTDK